MLCPRVVNHQRLLSFTSPRVRDAASALRRFGAFVDRGFIPALGELEVQESHYRSWSDASSRDRPGQKIYFYSCSTLDLLQHSSYAFESSCLVPRLPLWRDVADELNAAGLQNADLSLSPSQLACPIFDQSSLSSYRRFCLLLRFFF